MTAARIVPILNAQDIARAKQFYCDVLGADLVAEHRDGDGPDDPSYCSFVLMGAELHVTSTPGQGGAGIPIYVYCADVDGIGARVLEKKPEAVTIAPIDQTWGMRECYIRDPDGNTLRFGRPLKTA